MVSVDTKSSVRSSLRHSDCQQPATQYFATLKSQLDYIVWTMYADKPCKFQRNRRSNISSQIEGATEYGANAFTNAINKGGSGVRSAGTSIAVKRTRSTTRQNY